MQPLEEQIWQLAEPLLAAEGVEPIHIECLRMKTRWLVRVYMDKPQGAVTVDDCARVSDLLGDLLDVHDVPPGPYTLEVSSPGLDRPLSRDKDFLKYRGSRVNLRLAGSAGRRRIKGELVDYVEQDGRKVLVVREGGATFRIPREEVLKANLEYEL